ncbi:MAG: phage major capsid protein [Proteobacteria bacterium]|nr:phage major capsid protein [Pseudomonadota bacterium]
MENDTPEALDASFDLLARQEAAEAALGALRGDIEEVKSRLSHSARPARPLIGGGNAGVDLELKGFVDGYLRQGREAELKSMSVGSLADGGYDVPQQIDARIAERMKVLSPIRAVAQVVQTGSAGYRKLVSLNNASSGWVAETATRPETASPKFAQIAPPYGELYANPSASQQMLDDAAFDLESWLADEIAREFARAEGAAFVSGTGTNQPLGFLASPVAATNDAARAFGTLQFIGSGNATGFDATPELHLIDMVMAAKPAHRQGAVWVMNSNTLAAVRKLKDAEGAFLWQGGLVDGQPDRLLGYPVIEAADMPDIAANAFPIAFGNFQNGYLITERMATRILRDPYSNKPFVNFYATKRIGGQVLDSDAIKLLKITA